jgi:hypothetical protein
MKWNYIIYFIVDAGWVVTRPAVCKGKIINDADSRSRDQGWSLHG